MDPLKRELTDSNMLKLMKTTELLRILDREVPGQLLSVFFYVASHNPCHKLAMEEDLGIKTSSASRLTDWLSDYHRLGKPGLGLIKKYTDASNRRRQYLILTEKGEALINQIKDIVFYGKQET